MRCLGILLFVGALAAAEAEPAPVTITSTDGSGPTSGARATDSMLAADKAWARARQNAELQAQAVRTVAARQTAQGIENRGTEMAPEITGPGNLAALAEQDEVALLIELQRRRNRSTRSAGNDLLAGEMAASVATFSHLPSIDQTPEENGSLAHPSDEPHPGPQAPTDVKAPDRPERFPTP